MSYLRKSLAALSATLCCLTSCTTGFENRSVLLDRLDSRGAVLLASDNPFLPANRLIRDEMESSVSLREFINRRGMPVAIEVDRGLFDATTIKLLYPAQKESYTLTQRTSDWEIGVPQPMSNSVIDSLKRELAVAGLTVANAGKSIRDSEVISATGTSVDATARAGLARAASPSHATTGDLVHTVKFPGESLSVIAVWYTGLASDARKIAAANHRREFDGVQIGEKIRVPAKLVKNRKPLTKDGLRQVLR